MKKIIIPFLLMVFMISIVEDAEAQKKRRKKRDTDTTEEEDTRRSRRSAGDADEDTYNSFSDKLSWDINIGNISLSNGYFGLSLKPAVGYKLHNRIIPGIGVKYFYNLYSQQNFDDIHLNDIGGYAFTRLKITESIFAQVEYTAMNFDADYGRFAGFPDFDGINRKTVAYPSFGGGYASGFGDWMSTIQLLFIASEEARDISRYPVEFWFGFTRNF